MFLPLWLLPLLPLLPDPSEDVDSSIAANISSDTERKQMARMLDHARGEFERIEKHMKVGLFFLSSSRENGLHLTTRIRSII